MLKILASVFSYFNSLFFHTLLYPKLKFYYKQLLVLISIVNTNLNSKIDVNAQIKCLE